MESNVRNHQVHTVPTQQPTTLDVSPSWAHGGLGLGYPADQNSLTHQLIITEYRVVFPRLS